jgi:hypothetical protein
VRKTIRQRTPTVAAVIAEVVHHNCRDAHANNYFQAWTGSSATDPADVIAAFSVATWGIWLAGDEARDDPSGCRCIANSRSAQSVLRTVRKGTQAGRLGAAFNFLPPACRVSGHSSR